jgi:hypothetical protein
MLICIAVNNLHILGVLSSRVHIVWALAQGGTLEDRPRYNKSRCFETFPFPVATPEQQARIRDLAEQIDAHRKRVLDAHADLTLTGLYNVLERIKVGAGITAKDKLIHEKGLVAVLKSLHEELDQAVLDAYGWQDLIGQSDNEQTLLARLVALNAERRAEEAQGQIRWLRPDFQAPQVAQTLIGLESGQAAQRPGDAALASIALGAKAPKAAPQAWPPSLPGQMQSLARLLADSAEPLSLAAVAASYTGKGKWKSRLPDILEALAALGRARRLEDGRWMG